MTGLPAEVHAAGVPTLATTFKNRLAVLTAVMEGTLQGEALAHTVVQDCPTVPTSQPMSHTCVLHSLDSVSLGHASEFLGVPTMLRERVCRPVPQLALQRDQEPHEDTKQSGGVSGHELMLRPQQQRREIAANGTAPQVLLVPRL